MKVQRRLQLTVEKALARFPVVALLGPRQVGKTTLAAAIAERTDRDVLRLDLELPSHVARLADPELYLGRYTEALVVLDEIQRVPELFPVLRALVDADRRPGRFLLLGSASPELLRQSAETLAGRIRYLELAPFTIDEVGRTQENLLRLWLRGGFPGSYLAASDEESSEWRSEFIRTYLERDVPALGIDLRAEPLRRFWRMLAHRHAQLWNASEMARSLGVSPPTVASYLDVLVGTFLARRLEPYQANLGKRLVKSPKVYMRDSGLLHALLDISDLDDLQGHPVVGASWEGFLIEQLLTIDQPRDAAFYRTAAGAELDLVVSRGRRPTRGYEMKYSSAPAVAKGFWQSLTDLELKRADVLYPGEERWPLREGVEVVPAVSVGE
ncbi:MAG: ATP-binding protein [Trueperaceae bacterium]|nr:ATP-binding protein [Trueperaceae bacterium]